MDVVKVLFLSLAYITGTTAASCPGLYCVFGGCCSNGPGVIYCCFSNKASIGIIVVVALVILSIVALCTRRYLLHRADHCHPPPCSTGVYNCGYAPHC